MSIDLFDLTGRVAIVTGSSRGIGAASARAFAQHGAHVVVSGRNAEACNAQAAEINDLVQASGCSVGSAVSVPANIGRKEDLQRLVDTAEERWGRVDIVMANAAIHPWTGSLLDLPDETFTKFMNVNVRSSIWLAQMTIPGMISRGYGRFIVVSSIVGILGDFRTGAYGLTKAADMQLVRNLAAEFASEGICANCIAPGTFTTEMARSQWDDPEVAAGYLGRNPSRRFGDPDEIAGVAVMLAARAGGYINGQTIVADGGHVVTFESDRGSAGA